LEELELSLKQEKIDNIEERYYTEIKDIEDRY